MKVLKYIVIVFILSCVYFSCRKEDLITEDSAKLTFSIDTITFDTIFASIGSTTKNFRIYNSHNRPIKVSEIYLAGG